MEMEIKIEVENGVTVYIRDGETGTSENITITFIDTYFSKLFPGIKEVRKELIEQAKKEYEQLKKIVEEAEKEVKREILQQEIEEYKQLKRVKVRGREYVKRLVEKLTKKLKDYNVEWKKDVDEDGDVYYILTIAKFGTFFDKYYSEKIHLYP